MQLLERYLRAVEFWLPEAGRADIVAELGEDIRSGIEDREAGLGRELQEDELVELLRARGHPFLVAARYRPRRALIGPELYRLYGFTLKVVLVWVLLPLAIASAGLSLLVGTNPWAGLLAAPGGVWRIGWTALVAVTIAFAVAERLGLQARLFRGFDPRGLRLIGESRGQRGLERRVFVLVGRVVFTVWAVVALGHGLVYSQEGVRVVLTPAWRAFFWPGLVLAVVSLGVAVADLVRPSRSRPRLVLRLVSPVFGLVLVALLLRAAPGVVLARAGKPWPALIMGELYLNMELNMALVATGVILLLVLGWRARALWRGRAAAIRGAMVVGPG